MKVQLNRIKRKSYKLVWLVLAVCVVVAGLFLPTKYYVETPGGAYQVSKYFKIDQPQSHSGGFYFTAVSIRPAMVFDYLTNSWRSFSELVPKKEIDGDNTTEEHNKVEQFYMADSINNAVYFAAKTAHVPVKKTFEGIYVMDVLASSDFKGKLAVGDVINQVDGHTFHDSKELIAYFAGVKLGQTIRIGVQRAGRTQVISGQATKLPETKRVGIGITLTEKSRVTSTPAVHADITDIGGPSAGLMFTLELYQQLAHQDIAQSRKIAGTGTIDETGHVGSIGGIDKKVAAAAKKGAKIFFAPSERLPGMTKRTTNYAEAVTAAKKLKTEMKIVPVKNFTDALNYLTQH